MKSIKSFGKLNLYLKVFKGRDKNNLPIIKTLMIPYHDIWDTISIDWNKEAKTSDNNYKKIQFIEEGNIVECKINTVIYAVNYFFTMNRDLQLNKNITITLNKNSPVGSGLGYAASNAIATFKLLYSFYNINYDEIDLIKFARLLGSDALFFVNCTAVIISNFNHYKIKIYRKKIDYKKYKVIFNKDIPSITNLVYKQYLKNYDYYRNSIKFHHDLYNALEEACFDLYPNLYQRAYKLMQKYDYVMVAGSGSSFICFNN